MCPRGFIQPAASIQDIRFPALLDSKSLPASMTINFTLVKAVQTTADWNQRPKPCARPYWPHAEKLLNFLFLFLVLISSVLYLLPKALPELGGSIFAVCLLSSVPC